MIDTDKYEGHTPAEEWGDIVYADGYRSIFLAPELGIDDPSYATDLDRQLMAAAPDLLAEVKRLRSIADDLYAYIVSDASISLEIIEEQMDWRNEE